jgi:hypothetical protein
LTVISLALQSLRRNDAGFQAALAGFFDSGGAFAVAEDEANLSIGEAPGGDAIGQSLEIRAPATQEHSNTLGHKLATLAYPFQAPQAARHESQRKNLVFFLTGSDGHQTGGTCDASFEALHKKLDQLYAT